MTDNHTSQPMAPHGGAAAATPAARMVDGSKIYGSEQYIIYWFS